MDVHVTIKGELELRVDELPVETIDLIKSALTFPNEDRQIQAREQIQGWWDLPETISLWREEQRRSGHVLLVPRGFADNLVQGVKGRGGQVVWNDQRTGQQAAAGYFRPILLRGYQHEAAIDLIRSEQGFYECPPGGGKTVTALGIAALVGLKTLVIVDKADLVEQWRERAAQVWLDEETKTVRGLGLSLDFSEPNAVGKIGQDIWEERDLTIALRQTLWSRVNELDPVNWWAQWGLTYFDEGHHLAADTLAELCRRCSSKFVFGMSATPARTPTKGKIVHAFVGPIRHRTPKQRLREEGILVMPSVEIVKTDFQAQFWPTHDVKPEDECVVPKCRKQGEKHMHRNNYTSVQKKLVEDEARNGLIAKTICAERGHHHLVYSRQLKHLDAMKKALEAEGWDGPIFFLRGEENARGESRAIVAAIRDAEESVTFSTVADEALDIPILDRLHNVFPIRLAALVQQLIGRIERKTHGKDEAKIIDYVDSQVDVFAGQAGERDQVYRMEGYKITVTELVAA